MSEAKPRPWWTYTKEEQKQLIEEGIDHFLSVPGELSDRQKLLLDDAIGHAYRGLYSYAATDLEEYGLPESAWSDIERVDPAMVAGITRETLRRKLAVLRGSPVVMRQVFM